MKFGKRNKSIVDSLFLLALFGVFLIGALFIVLFGAKIYKNTVKASEDSFFTRTCCTYITEKFRQNDNSNGVNVSDVDGITVIQLKKTVNDISYDTYLYCDEGYIKEYTTTSNNSFDKSYGTKIMEASSLSAVKENNNLYKFFIKNSEGLEVSFFVSITSNVGGAEND